MVEDVLIFSPEKIYISDKMSEKFRQNKTVCEPLSVHHHEQE